jgi:hypothetical protein
MDICYITPIEGISKLLAYLDDMKSFYTTPYRFFMDYKYTYLLSMKGTAIDIKDNTYKTIQIIVADDDDDKTASGEDYKGMGDNSKQKIYQFRLSNSSVEFATNDTTDKLFNKVYAVDSTGKTKTIKVDTNSEDDTKSISNMRIIRPNNSNFGVMQEIKSDSESTGKTISVNISEVDASLLVPYKEYQFTFEKKTDKSFSGKYILCSKQEVYASNGDDDGGVFKCAVNLTFKQKS